MKKPEVIKAKKRYKEISELVETDENATKFLNGLVESATRYVTYVANMEAEIRKNSRDSRESYSAYYSQQNKDVKENFDRTKRFYHEGLISKLNVFNRYLFNNFKGKAPIGGIYSLLPESIKDRNAVGDWAGHLVNAVRTLE